MSPLQAITAAAAAVCQQIQTDNNIAELAVEPVDDSFPFMDDTAMDDGPQNNDFEQSNFNQFIGPDEAQFLVNPKHAVFTNARRVEVTLLKILTELEAPLWSFKVIMDWAFDASQSGYKFIPHQSSYKAQLQTISKWVGMEHMRPAVVNVPLPGVRPEDSIPVTTFDFVSHTECENLPDHA